MFPSPFQFTDFMIGGFEPSGLADKNASGEDKAAADDDLQAGEREAGIEVPMADQGDDKEFDANHHISPDKGSVYVADEKRQGMQEAAEKRHQAGDDTAKDGVAAAGEFAVVGEPLRESHGDASTHGGCCSNEEDSV